jgi:multidrug efflux system membrane fusion protein
MAAAQRRFRWGFLGLGLVLAGLIAWLAFGSHHQAQARPERVANVAVAPILVQNLPTFLTELGAAQAWYSDLINPQVAGKVLYVAPEGQFVRKGERLVSIECSPYQATLTQAQGALKRDQALLQGAQVDLARYQTLLKQNSIARQTEEDEEATVKQDQGTVLNDQGAVAAAQVNVGWCDIRSPIDGRVGVRLVDPGNIVSTALTTGIVSVNQVQPIAVTFTVPEGDFQRLAAFSDGFTRPLETEALSQETGQSLGAGELIVADNNVNQSTGTVAMKARFANPARQLWPGQFVNVRLRLETLAGALTVPAAAVNQGPNGSFVYVVGPDNKARNVPVALVTTQGGASAVRGALRPGELVVTDGQMSLRPGAQVRYLRASPAAARPAA